jgi:hypothetical protein
MATAGMWNQAAAAAGATAMAGGGGVPADMVSTS